jgi:hypothetical protein
MQILSRQETVKRIPRNQTLHEWMCFESEEIVKHNWTDVAVHDRKILNSMRPGDTRLWIISEFGSHFLPLYCKLYEKRKQEESEYDFSAIEIFMLRYVKDNRLAAMQSKIALSSTKFYFITKTSSEYNGIVAPASYRDVMDLVFNGKVNRFLED